MSEEKSGNERKEAEEYITQNEVAQMLKLSTRTVRTMTRSGLLGSYQIGRAVRYSRTEVHSALERLTKIKGL